MFPPDLAYVCHGKVERKRSSLSCLSSLMRKVELKLSKGHGHSRSRLDAIV